MARKHKKAVFLLALVASASLVGSIVAWWKPIAVKYHRHRINSLLDEEPEFDPVTGFGYFGDDWSNAFENHRDRLVELGYLVRREFPLESIKSPSLRFRRLWEELGARFPNHPHVEGHGYDSNSPATIVVWDELDKLAEWGAIIAAHDAPPANEVQIGQEDPQNVLPFVGRWASEEGDICYIITKDSVGNVRVESPLYDTWRTVFRNIHLEGNRIEFDQFTYIDPNDEFKSIIDKSGEHPFSGVRCETVLEVNPLDPNQLFESMSATSKYGVLTDPNVSVLRRFR